MTRAEAIALLECSANELADTLENVTANESAVAQLQRYVDAYNMGIAALREQGDSCGLNNAQLGRVIANSYIEGFEDCKAGRSPLVENKPLTLEELRQMDGEPVWNQKNAPLTLEELLQINEEPVFIVSHKHNARLWCIRGKDNWIDSRYPEPATFFWFGWCKHSQYGKEWLAYRDKPMEAHP